MAEERPYLFPRIRKGAYRRAAEKRLDIARKNFDKIISAVRSPHITILEPGAVLPYEFPPSLSEEFGAPRRREIKQNRYDLISQGPVGERLVKGERRR